MLLLARVVLFATIGAYVDFLDDLLGNTSSGAFLV
jgi:hypothetical protein